MRDAAPGVYVSEAVREVERLHRDLFTDAFRQLPVRDQLDRQEHWPGVDDADFGGRGGEPEFPPAW